MGDWLQPACRSISVCRSSYRSPFWQPQDRKAAASSLASGSSRYWRGPLISFGAEQRSANRGAVTSPADAYSESSEAPRAYSCIHDAISQFGEEQFVAGLACRKSQHGHDGGTLLIHLPACVDNARNREDDVGCHRVEVR